MPITKIGRFTIMYEDGVVHEVQDVRGLVPYYSDELILAAVMEIERLKERLNNSRTATAQGPATDPRMGQRCYESQPLGNERKSMTHLEIIDKVTAHLLQQGIKSTRHGAGGCAYRGECGLKCAVGCLITDEAYNTGIENMRPAEKQVKEALEKSGVPTDYPTIKLLIKLQLIHDENEPKSQWEDSLKQLRKEYEAQS